MKLPSRVAWLVPFLLAFLGASPQADVEEWVRQGNEAFAREEYDTAVLCYERAESLATDPGLIAFNKGAAYYRLGKYHEAEAARKNDPDRKDNRDDDPDNPRPQRNPSRGPGDESADPSRGSGTEQGMQDPRNAGQQPVPAGDQPRPGAGQQPVLRDGESPPLSPQETEALLKTVEARIRREHGQRQRSPVPPSPRNEKDW